MGWRECKWSIRKLTLLGRQRVSFHETHHQSPMAPPETYNMREIGGGHGAHGPAPGKVFDYNSVGVAGAGGAAGAARARSMRDGGSYGQTLQEGESPYPA
jgi:hypothetical protein